MAAAKTQAGGLDKVRALLAAMAEDEYVRFKYGKALDAARRELDQQARLDPDELERGLVGLLELVRGRTEGPTGHGPKSRPRSSKPGKEPGHAPLP